MSPIPCKAVALGDEYMLHNEAEDLGPCRQAQSSKQCTLSSCCKVPTLDLLIEDCFRYSIGELHDETRTNRVESFQKVVTQLHCQENLAFMIEIYKYEYFYGKLKQANEAANKQQPTKYLSSSRLLSFSMEDLPHPSTISRHLLHTRSQSATLSKVDSNEFVSVFDDIMDSSPSRRIPSWTASESEPESKESETQSTTHPQDIETDCRKDLGLEVPTDGELLSSQWNHIVRTYVRHDSPLQINLSNMSYREIMEADAPDSPADPSALLRAQHEIFQLIKENAYIPFINLSRETKTPSQSPLSPPACPISGSDTRPQSVENCPQLPQAHARDMESPLLSPTLSHSRHWLKKNRNLPFSSPLHQAESGSTSSSASSISNLLSYLKLHSPTSSRSHTPVVGSPPSTASSPKPPQPHSRKIAAQDVARTQSLKLNKLWKKKQ